MDFAFFGLIGRESDTAIWTCSISSIEDLIMIIISPGPIAGFLSGFLLSLH